MSALVQRKWSALFLCSGGVCIMCGEALPPYDRAYHEERAQHPNHGHSLE
jgi:hypothetical protein